MTIGSTTSACVGEADGETGMAKVGMGVLLYWHPANIRHKVKATTAFLINNG
jgi:hypothetical protein